MPAIDRSGSCPESLVKQGRQEKAQFNAVHSRAEAHVEEWKEVLRIVPLESPSQFQSRQISALSCRTRLEKDIRDMVDIYQRIRGLSETAQIQIYDAKIGYDLKNDSVTNVDRFVESLVSSADTRVDSAYEDSRKFDEALELHSEKIDQVQTELKDLDEQMRHVFANASVERGEKRSHPINIGSNQQPSVHERPSKKPRIDQRVVGLAGNAAGC